MWYLSLNRVRVSSTKPYIWTQQLKTAKGRGRQIQTVRAAIILPLGTETIFAQKESLQRQHFHIWLHNATHTEMAGYGKHRTKWMHINCPRKTTQSQQ